MSESATVDTVLAIDWSGELKRAARKIWLCEIDRGTVVRLENGRSRDALAAEVIAVARRNPGLVAGFDFAFSLPAWFLGDRKLADARALWALAAEEGEAWLRGPAAPFWGRNGVKRPAVPAHLRRTELEAGARTRRQPSSVFKLVGNGQVGPGSVRGMATLARIATEGGFRVWPFDPAVPGHPVAVEIWPRLLYAEPVHKMSATARAAYLDRHATGVDERFVASARASDDAFDALTAALALWTGAESWFSVAADCRTEDAVEGRIWGT